MKNIQNNNQEKYQKIVEGILRKSSIIMNILEVLESYAKKNPDFKNYYLAAGCINQTILNDFHGYPLDNGIEDYDIVYYDEDTTYEKEDIIIKDLTKRLPKNVSFDIKNQKRVPIWYNEKFNENRKEYTSVENAISRWNSTITCIGVRLENNNLIIYSPYGLKDLIDMTIRPVKEDVTQELYEKKAKKWQSKWKRLKIIPW